MSCLSGQKNLSKTLVTLLFVILSSASIARAQGGRASGGGVSGVVRDTSGATVPEAKVWMVNTQQAVLRTTKTDASGRFSFEGVPAGTYELRVSREDFGNQRVSAHVVQGGVAEVNVVLEPNQLSENVTVTAEAGQVQDKERIAQQVNIIPEEALRLRTTAVLAQVADEEVGLALQRTSPTIGAIFVRGLTGKNVATYIDGVRYTTAAGRGGINTFFNLNEPSSLRAIEVLRGPNSAQYGSDSLGGTISLVTRGPAYGGLTPETHGEFNTFFNSADLSFGGSTLLTYGSRRFGLLLNAAARRVNTLRPANGLDSHSSITRFLGLPSDILGTRLTDTAFTQYGGTIRMNFAPSPNQQLAFYYQRGQQDGGKRYDQTLGGDGNLIADLRNLMNDFFYTRYTKQGVGFFDNASFTFSYNSQREERVNQGGRGNPFAGITHQYERTNVFGGSFYLDKQLTARNTLLFGGDLYHERVNAPAYTLNPLTGISTPSRPRVPDQARYISSGIFLQDVWDVLPQRLRLSGALRYNVASYRSRAADAAVVAGRPLFPDDSLRVDDFSGRFGVVGSPFKDFNVAFNYSRGFRAPNITDLGTLGLTGDGFEVDPATAIALGGTIGATAGRDAVSTGLPVAQQQSEISNNFDLSFGFRKRRFDTELTLFLIDINRSIVKQALILPPGATGLFLGGERITEQLPNGVVFVGLSSTPVLVRANYTDARIRGLEYETEFRLTTNWTFAGNFTYIHAEDKETGLPPNIEGGTPPPLGFLRLRYQPAGHRYWIEGYSTLARPQTRLSSLDLSDRRTGATRSRNDIRDFFRRGACMRGLVNPGPDRICATGDETILIPTGETLAQLQNRVLGSAASAPLFPYLPGYGIFNVRGGWRINENSEIDFAFENIGDKTYRGPSWGIDGPGRSVTARYRYKF
ncbi:MAG TPA: TonB-dependent receptor [Pyrinomonadaceae bacterium]|jgi:hemoglobin/transferrin/lactoferrin receptor protein